MESIVGFRFHPTDDELVDHYLRLKRLGKDSEVRDIIAEVDVCKWEPSELPRFSLIKSDDDEWFFFCPRELKNSSSHRTNRNRATKSGFWKVTGRGGKVKAKRSNKVIGSKKILVFHRGRVPNGIKTNWVMHEYHSISILPHQKDFVLCRIIRKPDAQTDVSTCDEFETSGYAASEFEIEAPLIFEREANGELFLQPNFQLPVSNTQGSPFINPVFPNSHNDELNWTTQFVSDRDEEQEFLNSVLVDQDETSQEEIRYFRDMRAPESLQKVHLVDGGPTSDTDTDTAQAQGVRSMGTSSFFNDDIVRPVTLQARASFFNNDIVPPVTLQSRTSFFNDDIVRHQSREVSSSSANQDQYRSRGSSFHRGDPFNILGPSINCLSRVRSKSPPKVRTSSTPHHQHRLRHSAGVRVSHRKVQLPHNNSHRIVSHDKPKDALKDSITTSLPPQKETSMDSDKEQKMAQCTNTKKSFKSTTLDSAGSDQKGYFVFVEASQQIQSHVSSPPLVYLAKLLFGLSLFLVVIREVVVYGM